MTTEPLILKLMVNKATKKVVFAECGFEFVDILFSFLTLPLGTAYSLIGKPNSWGSIASLYGCIEDSEEAQYLMSDTSRAMLLRPRNAAIRHLKRLRVDYLTDEETPKFYACPLALSRQCSNKDKLISTFPNARCRCNGEMNAELDWFEPGASVRSGSVFIEAVRFVIDDQLFVGPICGTTLLLEKFGIKDWNAMEERSMKIGKGEVLQLLKYSLTSETPLTDLLSKAEKPSLPLLVKQRHYIDLLQQTTASESREITLKLFLCNKGLVYAETRHDFVDLVFSFLTFPLGSIQRRLNPRSCFGCLDNLYESALKLSSTELLKIESKRLLLNPKLPPCFNCKSQLLKIEEEQSSCYYVYQRPIKKKNCSCHCMSRTKGARCKCKNLMKLDLSLIDPRNPRQLYETRGGGYSQSSRTYMVTNELVVKPLSIINGMSGAKGKLEELEMRMSEAEALALLRASLTSKTALTDTFLDERPLVRFKSLQQP